jgi:hypothetical protein
MSVFNLKKEDLLESTNTAPGRIRTFLLNPEKNTLPPSCTLFVWNGDLFDLLSFAARSLKAGAGVKVIFNQDADLGYRKDFVWDCFVDNSSEEYGEFIKYRLETDPPNQLRQFVDYKEFDIQDSMEGTDGIIESWKFMIDCADRGENPSFNFSNLRPAGTENSKGLVSSGALSFINISRQLGIFLNSPTIYNLIRLLGTLNSVMRRGGYKKGIIVSSMDYRSKYIEDYLDTPIVDIDGSHKKGIRIDKNVLSNPALVRKIADSCNSESSFLAKILDQPGLYENVCNGILLEHKATCLIWRVNLGLCRINDIPKAFADAARNLIELHYEWRNYTDGSIFIPVEKDLQIGLDVFGLANLLAIEGFTYKQFVEAGKEFIIKEMYWYVFDEDLTKLQRIIKAILKGFQESIRVCDEMSAKYGFPKLERIHCVEPAQFHAYDVEDREGNSLCRGIWPPLGQFENRVSNIEKNVTVYHGDVETLANIGKDLYFELNSLWQDFMNRFGRPHCISMDWIEEASELEIKKFLYSPCITKYYSLHEQYSQDYIRKSVGDRVSNVKSGIVCDCVE